MPPEIVGSWLGVVLGMIALAGFIYNWFTSGEKKVATDLAVHQKAAGEEIQALETKIAEQGVRIQQIESDLKHLPDRDQTHRLELAVQRLTGQMETLDERLKPVAAISNRLQEFLIDQARGSK